MLPPDTHHPALNIALNIQYSPRVNTEEYYYYRLGDYGGLNNYLLRINWIHIYEMEFINDKLNLFYIILKEGIDQYVPKRYRKNGKFPIWFNTRLRQLTARRNFPINDIDQMVKW